MRKIGVVGPEQSINRIIEVGKAMEPAIEFISFAYADAHEAVDIVKRNIHKAKGWLFSGSLPFMLAKEAFGSDDNFAYCAYDGAGLYRCFLQVAYHQKIIMERISIDIPSLENLPLAIEELEIPNREIYMNRYGTQFDTREIIQFHQDLWEQGKTDAAVTSLAAAYVALKQDGKVPVYRNSVTANSIRDAIKVILGKTSASFFRSTQVGLGVIEIENFDEVIEKAASPYNIKRLELRISKELIDLSEKLNGGLLERGRGRYEISSSRGAIDREMGMLKDVVRRLSLELNIPVAVGIGFGETVSSAETNARRALLHAKKRKKEKLVIIQEDGVLVESVGQPEELTYEYYSDDQELLNKLHEADVGIKSYKRIEATIRRMKWSTFTSSHVAEELAVTERNVRRIFFGLTKVGLLECIGEEFSTVRGRPSRLYRLR
jgi:hypothetical protein